jgi:hypothetical protein
MPLKATESVNWNKVINAIIHVESRGDVNAKSGKSVGPMQITPILVEECNRILKMRNSRKRYSLADRVSLNKSKEMFLLIQDEHNPENSVEHAIRSWNGGQRYSKRATDKYYRKVLAAMEA